MTGIYTVDSADGQAAELGGLAREPYDISSALPDLLRRRAQAKAYRVGDGACGYACNADLVTMIDSLYTGIGVRAIQDRMEEA